MEAILQLDLLRTDWHHAPAYPTFLCYNPHAEAKQVEIEVGPEPRDLYDSVAHDFILRGARGKATFRVEPDSACILVVTPAAGLLTRQGRRTLIKGVVVDYASTDARDASP